MYQPAARTPPERTRKSKAARSAPGVVRVALLPPEATRDAIFYFANRPINHSHLTDRGLEAFPWAQAWFDRYAETGELPESRAELVSLLVLPFRAIRFSVFAEEYDHEIDAALPIARAILARLHAMGIDNVDFVE